MNAEQDDLDLRPAGENGHPASKQQQGGVQGGVGVAKDGTPASMLLFSGVQEVHGLADYLLETQGFRGLHQVCVCVCLLWIECECCGSSVGESVSECVC